ncbi:MAG: hypothetical protein II671_01585 [Salinivirgaceae bacterium]|nr:hypothetical protein [Salinivirgaceae bacterium]
MKNLNLFFAAAIGLVAIGCSNNQGNSKVKQNIDINVDVSADINRAQQVFYALPSPIETAHLIQSAGVSYNMDLSNPVDNAEKYSTTMKKALNFGVYGADLSYASLFNQTQTTIQFMATEKKIAEELGIYDFVDADVAEHIESIINDRDSVMEILADGFTNASDCLKDAGRAEVAALIVAGGWIEGLYLATQLAGLSADNSRLIDLVIDQRLSLTILIKLLDNYKTLPSVSTVYDWLIDLQSTYDKVKATMSETKVETGADGKTTFAAETKVEVNDKIFNAICQKADSIRSLIVE